MKIFIIGLFSIIAACSGTPRTAVIGPGVVRPEDSDFYERLKINLSKLETDPLFAKVRENIFQTTAASAEPLKIFRYKFENNKKAQEYIFNRRMLLHRSFEENIAPYFGVLKSDKECMKLVDVKGDVIHKDLTMDYIRMDLPINANQAVSDCLDNNVWGVSRYFFYHCKETNEVFEARLIRRLQKSFPEVTVRCQ